jgi:hypothetical protein
MIKVCQQNPAMPRRAKPLTLSSISVQFAKGSHLREHGSKAGTEEAAMNVTQRDRDLGTAYAIWPPATRT